MDDDANGDVDVEESDEVSSLTLRASLLFLCKQSLKLSRQAVPWGEVFLLLACSLASHPYQGRWFSAEQPRGAGLTSLSVSGPAPVCLPAGSTMLTELCCLRGRGSPEAGLYSLPASLLYSCWSWRAPICPDSVFNPVLACGGEGKAVRSCPLETYTVCEEETEVPRKVVLNSRLQPLEVSWVVQTARVRGISGWKSPVIVSPLGITTAPVAQSTKYRVQRAQSTEPRVQSHHVWEDWKISVVFRLNLSQHFGEAAKLCQISSSDMVYILRKEVILVSPSCWLVHF